MPRPRIVTDEQRQRLAQIARARHDLPSNKQLAFEMGVSERTIESIMTTLMRQSRDSHGTPGEKIAS